MILAGGRIEPGTLSMILTHLAQNTRVCALVVDRDGRIDAVNKVGIEVLPSDPSEAVGSHWSALVARNDRARVDEALARAFDGQPVQLPDCRVADREGGWDLRAVPCAWLDGRVARLLVIATPHQPPVPADQDAAAEALVEALGQTLHTIANLSTSALSAANILRREVSPDRAEMLAQSLEESGHAAAQAMNALKALLLRGTPDE